MTSRNIDGGYAWLVLAASFLVHIMTYGMAWSTGVYNVIFLETFNQPKSITAWAGALPTAVMYAIGPVSSMLCNKYGNRKMVILGGLISGIGLALSYFATSLYYLYFSFGMLTGAGFGIAYIPSISAVSCYFEKRISLAAGLAASGVGVGNFVYPALIRWLINMFDWKQSLLILGAVSLNICVCGAVMRPVRRTELLEESPILDITPFKKKGYLMLCINNFLFCCGISALYVHLTALAESKGYSQDLSAMLVSGLGIANLIGRVLYGVLASHSWFNAFVLYMCSFTLSGVCVCIVPFCETYEGLMTCAVVFGLLSACFGTLLVTILIELLGLQRFANGYGCLLLFEAAGQLLGGFLTGAMFDLTQSYTSAFIVGGLLCIVSGFVMIQPYLYVKNHPFTQEEILVSQEKLDLSQSIDIPANKFPSHRDLVQSVLSMESLGAVDRFKNLQKAAQRSTYSLNITKPEKKKPRNTYLPKAVENIRNQTFASTETI